MSSCSGTTIVLCGGQLNPLNMPVGTNMSNAMVPLNGKPVVGWILDDLIAKGIEDVHVVLRSDNERMAEYLDGVYQSRLHVSLVRLERPGSILDSLAAGLEASEQAAPVRIVLGDTLISDTFAGDGDFIYAGHVEDAKRWCVVTVGSAGAALDYCDNRHLPGGPHLAVAGFYHLVDSDLLASSVNASIAAGQRELSAALTRYGAVRPIQVKVAERWYDFGHIDNFTRAKHELLQARFFNSLRVNPVLNTITKISTDNEKLEDELSWYLTIPDELKILTPRIVNYRRIGRDLEIVQEYYGYPTLAELFVYGDLPIDAWRAILTRVLRVHEELSKYAGDVPCSDAVEMYLGKTQSRLERLTEQDPWWSKQLAAPSVMVNGEKLRNAPELLAAASGPVRRLAASVVPGVVHGDLCFSNILFDVNNQIIRLIDPRGRFGRRGIYGDPRYDLAKLRHSAHGMYDLIAADMFVLEKSEDGVRTRFHLNGIRGRVGELFDGLLRAAGVSIEDIQIIEGLLFVSMLPLHQGHPRRQRMMYYTGLQLLNEAV
jgi:dTDP-glucose pyrophosphorylase